MAQTLRSTIILAKNSDETAIEHLLHTLEPTLLRLAHRLADGLDPDESVQAGRVAIWLALPRVDLSRSDHALKAMLITTAANAIRDLVRGTQKRRPVPLSVVTAEIADDIKAGKREHAEAIADIHFEVPAPDQVMPSDALDHTLSNWMRQYAAFIRHTGSLLGAHKRIAARHRIHPAKAAARWNADAKRYREQHAE